MTRLGQNANSFGFIKSTLSSSSGDRISVNKEHHPRYNMQLSYRETAASGFSRSYLVAPISSCLKPSLQIANLQKWQGGISKISVLQQYLNSVFGSSYLDLAEKDDEASNVTVIPVREVPDSVARKEINRHIDQLLAEGKRKISAGEIACNLELDLNIVLEILEERGLL